MDKPISVIIPAYNAGKYIGEAIDSALAQTYSNLEVIAVDDGSTDDTRGILEPYIKEQKIRYIYQANRGLAGARNTGIRAAQGEYLAFLDADDIFLPEKIERQTAYLERHPECDVCYCDLWHFFEEAPERMLKLNYNFYSGERVFPELLKKNFINPLSLTLRRSVFDRFGYFNENLRRSEDWDYWVNLAWQGARFDFLPERLAKYRIRRQSGLSYDWSGEVLRKETAHGIFLRLKQKMSAAERNKYHIESIIFLHWLKLIYARLAHRFYPLRSFQLWRQTQYLK